MTKAGCSVHTNNPSTLKQENSHESEPSLDAMARFCLKTETNKAMATLCDFNVVLVMTAACLLSRWDLELDVFRRAILHHIRPGSDRVNC